MNCMLDTSLVNQHLAHWIEEQAQADPTSVLVEVKISNRLFHLLNSQIL